VRYRYEFKNGLLANSDNSWMKLTGDWLLRQTILADEVWGSSANCFGSSRGKSFSEPVAIAAFRLVE
jgi:hypothetical protein